VHCGQTVGCIKMKLGMQVGLGRGHIVLDGEWTQLLSSKGAHPPIFGPYLLWPNDWMDQDATWYGGRPRPRRLVLDGDPASPLDFWSMFIVTERLDETRWHAGLRPGDCVLDADPAPFQKGGGTPPIFGPLYCGQTAGCRLVWR